MLKPIYYFFTFGLLFLGTNACQVQGQDSQNSDRKDITLRDLYSAVRSQPEILLVDAWSNPEYGRRLRELATEFHHDRWNLTVKSYDRVTVDEIASVPTMLIGNPEQNSWIADFSDNLPFTIVEGQIEIAGANFNADTHSLVLSYYPNPINAKMPIGVFTSGDESLLWDLVNARISSFLRGNWGYEVLYKSQRVLLGNLSQKQETRWEVDPEQQIRLPGEIVHHWSSGPFLFKSYHQQLNEETMKMLTRECERELSDIMDFTGKALSTNQVAYTMYPTTEIKGLMTGNTDHSHMNFSPAEVHTSFDKHFQDRYYGKENQLLLRAILGNSSHEVLELGLALHFSSQWEHQGYQYWANHLFNAGVPMTVGDLIDPDKFDRMSGVCREAMAGSLVDFLIDNWGREQFLEKYSMWDPSQLETEQLTSLWVNTLSSDKPKTAISKSELAYLKGFNFTHEGYQIFNGYGSMLSTFSLEQVRQLGANAVAIVPYSWMADHTKPAPFRFSDRAGSENDEGVIHTICEAKSKGMFTLLKPQVWIGNSWPGEVNMKSVAEWDSLFDFYYQWISHYALMAEMYDVDALCIGVEFSKATIAQEHRWRKMITRLRKIYHGNLTYAANWGDEFENIRFWDQLDFIGLNCYYPLSTNERASVKQLEQGFSQVLKKVDKVKSIYKKPVVFTEIGFRSVRSPWLQPHEEAGDKQYHEGDQAIAYNVVLKALASSASVDGILWWKWPTDLQVQTEQDRRFVPAGKEAEDVIKKWFNETEN